MKVEIELDNLSELVQKTIERDAENVIRDQVVEMAHKQIDDIAKQVVEDIVSEQFQNMVNDYINNTTIKIGGGYWDDEEAKEYTIEQYIKQQLKERLESKILKVKKVGRTSSYNDDFENVSFEEYIKRTFNMNDQIKKELDTFMDGIRKDINATMKDMFDESTKSMLSGAVLNILSANETYRKIETNIKCIADKKV